MMKILTILFRILKVLILFITCLYISIEDVEPPSLFYLILPAIATFFYIQALRHKLKWKSQMNEEEELNQEIEQGINFMENEIKSLKKEVQELKKEKRELKKDKKELREEKQELKEELDLLKQNNANNKKDDE